ncbi:hypothetical protein A2U01_0022361, partial [Trifolium medium]|nr:hypothetical protein [Trifolium medium]
MACGAADLAMGAAANLVFGYKLETHFLKQGYEFW